MKAGFIGLGNLGKAMAKRLISEGINLTVWNRTNEKAKDLDCSIANTPAEVISEVDLVFLNLTDSNAVINVLTQGNGILEGNCDGKVIVDTTTNHFEKVLNFYDMTAQKGAFYIEAPVLGSVIPALQGLLTVLVSGERQAFEKVKPLIEKIGENIFYLEKPGLATKMKLINNLVLGSFMATLAEAIALGEVSGIDKSQVIDILLSGAGNCMILNAKKQKLINEDFSAHFSNSLIYKDLHYLQDFAYSIKKPLFTGSVIKELYGLAVANKLENEDFSSIYKLFKYSLYD
jgi:3-hydroxyisobutyrate dehydrogenase